MLNYIIRLDDACPTMDQAKWERIEDLLNRYHIKPIVGIIPDSKDPSFANPEITDFWENTARRYAEQGWIIAQHGLHHTYQENGRSEFVGKSYGEQMEMLKEGHDILLSHGICPTCFFALAHDFDETTVKICRDSGFFDFISDGSSFYPYKKHKMLFVPSLFDTPHKMMKFGIFTFVYHPNNMTEQKFAYLEHFIKENLPYFGDLNELLKDGRAVKKRGLADRTFCGAFQILRRMRQKIKKLKKER